MRDAPDRDAGGPSEFAAQIGGLDSARLVFKSGANEMLLRGSTDFDDLYRAKFDGTIPQVRLRDGVVSIQYKGRFQWDWRERRADVALNASVPWDVEIIGGSNKLQGKLTSVDLRSFELTGGASQLRLMLGRPTGINPSAWAGASNAVRTADRRHTSSSLSGRAGGIEFDRQKLGGAAQR